MEYLFVLAVGLAASTVSAIIGTGSSITLVPVLVYAPRLFRLMMDGLMLAAGASMLWPAW